MMNHFFLPVLALFLLKVSPATSFAGVDPAVVHHSATAAADFFNSHFHLAHAHASPQPLDHNVVAELLQAYKHSLASNPLQTKMMTGALLATTGDAIAQSREDGPYDKRRAGSFAAFDMAYRALQHASFPIITTVCKGQFLGGALASLGMASVAHSDTMTTYFAAIEQTLASQLGIVPFLYYPIFFAMTGAIQNLSMDASIERAQQKFLPLMSRNLLFWLPVQFIQFGFVEESMQIPFLSVCGLAWTFILSIMAGNANSSAASEEQLVADLNQMTQEMLLQEEMGAIFSAENTVPVQVEEEQPASFRKQETGSLVYDKSY